MHYLLRVQVAKVRAKAQATVRDSVNRGCAEDNGTLVNGVGGGVEDNASACVETICDIVAAGCGLILMVWSTTQNVLKIVTGQC